MSCTTRADVLQLLVGEAVAQNHPYLHPAADRSQVPLSTRTHCVLGLHLVMCGMQAADGWSPRASQL